MSMKKLASILLGLSLVIGAAAASSPSEDHGKDHKKEDKKHKDDKKGH